MWRRILPVTAWPGKPKVSQAVKARAPLASRTKVAAKSGR